MRAKVAKRDRSSDGGGRRGENVEEGWEDVAEMPLHGMRCKRLLSACDWCDKRGRKDGGRNRVVRMC